MAQLLVRGIEPGIARQLRRRAAAQGISIEEAHRRLLRAALTADAAGPEGDFIAFLRSVPSEGRIEFPRSADHPRDPGL
jgi:plasmid stability protein